MGIGVGSAAGVGAGVYRVSGGGLAPVLIHKADPDYTEEARNAKYARHGFAVRRRFDPTGTATNSKVQRSLGLGLHQRAVEAVKQWRFKPGQKDDNPVTVAASIEVNCRL